MATRSSRREATGRRNNGGLRESPQIGFRGRGCAGAVRGRLRFMGRQLRAGRFSVDANARGGLPRGVAARPDSPEAGVAHRVLGTTHWFAGEYAQAREHLERALALFQPGRDDDLAFRFGKTPASRRCATWPLRHGRWETSGARFPLLTALHERLASVSHIGTPLCEITRGDVRTDARRQCARRAERF